MSVLKDLEEFTDKHLDIMTIPVFTLLPGLQYELAFRAEKFMDENIWNALLKSAVVGTSIILLATVMMIITLSVFRSLTKNDSTNIEELVKDRKYSTNLVGIMTTIYAVFSTIVFAAYSVSNKYVSAKSYFTLVGLSTFIVPIVLFVLIVIVATVRKARKKR